ncbi:MAG TPA: hypothetical protein PKY25_01920 [Bacilli bacterium]|mgnify:CR=1 FL=1|nr:hypothetical protein [Bacilli bacterium]
MGENIDLEFESFDAALIHAKKVGATHIIQKYFVENKDVPGTSRAYEFAEVKNGKYCFFDSFEEANRYFMDCCYKDEKNAYIEIIKTQWYLEDLEKRQNSAGKTIK